MPRATEATYRDSLALRWIGEQYTARADVVAVVLGRLSPAEPREPGRIGLRTVRHHVQRWERLRFAERRWLRGCCWVVPTRRGLTAAGVDLPPYEPVAHRLAHTHAVAVVRLFVETGWPDSVWISERQLRAARASSEGSWWLPDGMVGDVTVEVELSPKKLVDLKEAAAGRQHPRAHSRVYFAPVHRVDTLRRHLATLKAEVDGAARGDPWLETEVWPLPDVAGVTYAMPDVAARRAV